MPLSTPMPNNRGRVMIFAKFNGRFNKTATAIVTEEASNIGPSTRSVSTALRKKIPNMTITEINANMKASRKASTTDFLASTCTTGSPVTIGAISRTCETNSTAEFSFDKSPLA